MAKDTKRAQDNSPKPENSAIADPAPATEMESPSGAFVEPEIKNAIPVDHPAVDNNPRAGTSEVQNGQDFNDPERKRPGDENFVGQGLDPAPYGTKKSDK